MYIFIDPQVTNRETLNFNTKTKNVETGKLPIQVAIGHELIHSIRSMKGIAKPHKYVRCDYRNVNMNYMEDVADIEELETIGIIDGYKFTENMIRKEQGESSIRIKY